MSIPLSRQSRQRANRRSRYQRSSDLPVSGYLSVGISDDNGDTPYSSFNGSCRSSRRRSHESTADGSAAVECGTIFSISFPEAPEKASSYGIAYCKRITQIIWFTLILISSNLILIYDSHTLISNYPILKFNHRLLIILYRMNFPLFHNLVI